jgi:hypothetical protein
MAISLYILRPKNRNCVGRMYVYKDGALKGSYWALGRGNHDASFTVENGNTPTGTYRGNFEDSWGRSAKSYGKWGLIRLKAISGDALQAKTKYGRDGLLIHGGALGAAGSFHGKWSLRPTHGCVGSPTTTW